MSAMCLRGQSRAFRARACCCVLGRALSLLSRLRFARPSAGWSPPQLRTMLWDLDDLTCVPSVHNVLHVPQYSKWSSHSGNDLAAGGPGHGIPRQHKQRVAGRLEAGKDFKRNLRCTAVRGAECAQGRR